MQVNTPLYWRKQPNDVTAKCNLSDAKKKKKDREKFPVSYMSLIKYLHFFLVFKSLTFFHFTYRALLDERKTHKCNEGQQRYSH